jgi:AraC family transcriptional regulator
MLLSFDGACVRRVVDRSGARVPEHAHDWPVLSIFVIGEYLNRTEIGETFIDGPSAILYRAGAAHRNTVGATGFEQLEIEFDPAWLGYRWPTDVPVIRWMGGRAGGGARQLARLCGRKTNEIEFRAALRHYIETALGDAPRKPANWIGEAVQRLKKNPA